MARKQNNVLDRIGNTPLVPIQRLNPNPSVEVLAKLEYFNPGGSVKDRPALYMIEEAERTGDLSKEKIIVEATSGNTGIGLALVAAVKGYRILLTMAESVSEERIRILRALGAEIKFTPAHMSTDGAIEDAYQMLREAPDKYWLADQFNNEANWKAHYHGTANEIWEQTRGNCSAVVATMGTTGTVMGLSKRFQELDPHVQIIGVEPYMGHKIQGLKNMKESYQPGIFDRKRLARTIHIDDDTAFETARQLAKQEGMFVGMSSGAAMAAALELAREMDRGRVVVILPDGGERYLSTPLFLAKKKSGIRIYNTLTRSQEELIPLKEHQVTLYSCGPTLCQHIHVGHCRPLVFADLLRRYLEFKGYRVTHVMNLTDLDDRTIERAEREGSSIKEFSDQYYDALMADMAQLNVREPTEHPRASEHVEDMIAHTQKLLEKGFAYEKYRSLYFDISRYKDYGQLSRIDLNKIRLGKTVDLDLYEKENPRDFTLLKRATLSELKKGVFYQTAWGNVRPGFHLECAAIALKYLGPTYDVHIGGSDLVFPHHENAIAITRAVTGKPLANYWLHNELVMVDGRKPSQRPGTETLTLRYIMQQGYSGRDVRYWVLSHHYRKQITFSWQKLMTARNTVAHLDHFTQKLHMCRSGPPQPDMDQLIYDLRHGFTEAMDEDLNVSAALAALFKFIHRVNRVMDRTGLSTQDRDAILKALDRLNGVLGVMELEEPRLSGEVKALIEQRARAREQKNWEEADRLRALLRDRGVEVIDTRDGTVWRTLKQTPDPPEGRE